MEGDEEQEGVVPANWVKNADGMIHWPPGIDARKALANKSEPTSSWRRFPLVKIKIKSGEKLFLKLMFLYIITVDLCYVRYNNMS